jgi:hypothetical protein
MSRPAAKIWTMAIDIPTTEPARIRAGDTITWRKSLAEYPATDGWTLSYRLINATAKFNITTTADGADHLVTVAKATSATYTAGDYTLIAWVDNGTERVSLPGGRITVLPDLAAVAAAGYDSRSQAKKMLDAVDAALLSLSSGERLAVVEAEVAGRRLKYNFDSLMKLRNLYAAQVRAEESAERAQLGLAPRNKLNVRL